MSYTPTGGPAAHSEHAILPGAESLILVQTSPNAVCFLTHSASAERRIQLDADDRGHVRFHARAPKHGATLDLDLEVTGADGSVTRHKITLRGDQHLSSAPPLPPPCGDTVPALEGDPMALSNAQLIARGYPPRPDPSSAEHFARWHRKVSRPFVRVPPTQVPHHDVRFSRRGAEAKPHIRTELPLVAFSPSLPLPPPLARLAFNANSDNWSGALLNRPAAQFCAVQADWYVPGVNSSGPFYSAVAEWVGLDNAATDLYQAGTDSECYIFFSDWIITVYWMWAETLPFAPWGLPNFPVSPRDEVSVDIFLADQDGQTWFNDGDGGGLTPRDDSVWLMIYNHSQGASFWGFYPRAREAAGGLSTAGFSGLTAEFVVERPQVGGYVPLANFGVCGMHSCWYGDSQYGNRRFRLGNNGSTPFDGNLTYITMLNSGTGNTLAVPISLPDSTSPGGYEIVWIWTGYS